MRALRWHGPGDIRLDSVAEPEPAADEVLLRVTHCGICGSDLKEWRQGPVIITPEPHPVTGNQAPVTLGHEFIGEVVARGKATQGLDVGTRVAVEGEMRCGTCWFCQRGEYHLCQYAAYIGFNRDGGLAEFVAVPAVQAFEIPESLPDLRAALVEPFAVAVHAVRSARVSEGDTVVVSGAGPVGLGAVLASLSAGARVIVVEPAKAKREQALRFGATAAISPETADLADALRDLVADGRGADIAFESSGTAGSLRSLIAATRKGGTIMTIGIHAAPVELDINAVTFAERRIVGSQGYQRDFGPTFDLLARTDVDPTEIVTRQVRLDEAIERGFGALADRSEGHMKILISP